MSFHIGKKVRYRGPLLDQIHSGQIEVIGEVVSDPQHSNVNVFVLYVPVRFDPPFGTAPSLGIWYINACHEGTMLEEI